MSDIYIDFVPPKGIYIEFARHITEHSARNTAAGKHWRVLGLKYNNPMDPMNRFDKECFHGTADMYLRQAADMLTMLEPFEPANDPHCGPSAA